MKVEYLISLLTVLAILGITLTVVLLKRNKNRNKIEIESFKKEDLKNSYVNESPIIFKEQKESNLEVEKSVNKLDLNEDNSGEKYQSKEETTLIRSQNEFRKSILNTFSKKTISNESIEELEDTLLSADIGLETTEKIISKLNDEVKNNPNADKNLVFDLLEEAMLSELHPEMDRSINIIKNKENPAVILMVGVNGVGKTTTAGKLARILTLQNKKVVLGAADTFRAAAREQLQTWGNLTGSEVVVGEENADPASVAYKAVAKGKEDNFDIAIIDTAGRLHTKTGLMDQLGKVKRVIEKQAEISEILLVLDATVGQNGLQQAKIFAEVVNITGVVLTKLDGTAKGGIVYKIQNDLNVPIKLVGLGEGKDQLVPFNPENYINSLLKSN